MWNKKGQFVKKSTLNKINAGFKTGKNNRGRVVKNKRCVNIDV